ncbi:tripartite tricarboxylate transporter substrate binding protein [bacterium]|nr:tripartite tricarboxylate transporter substrate binding protein [bacterium]NDD11969.1 tripartite tricarboxylate transporter substrate binding protein [Betaproteobacteria bacterium]
MSDIGSMQIQSAQRFRRRIHWPIGLSLATLFASFSEAQTASQNFPTRPVKIVVPFPPGGVVDLMARLVAPRMTAELGQAVLVENRPGAGATLGATVVAKSPPDGYILLLGTIVTHATAPHLSALQYDSGKDFTPIGFHGFNAAWLVLRENLPIQDFRGFVDYVRKNPNKLNYGSPSIGSSSHLSAELLRQRLNLSYQHIPYKGSAPALQDLVSGQLDFMFDNIGSSMSLVKAGKLRAIAVTSAGRSPSAPEIPTISESGLEGFDVTGWAALFAPGQTPPDIVNKLNRALNLALSESDVRQKLADVGIVTRTGTPRDLEMFVKSEYKKWGEVIRIGSIKAD